MAVELKRAYMSPEAEDGLRVLVDRLWPRGLKKDEAAIDLWPKDLAPSTALRRWFAHDPARWEEFRRRYRAELEEQAEAVAELRTRAERETVTLVYGARDEVHNNAVVLAEYLGEEHGGRGAAGGEAQPG